MRRNAYTPTNLEQANAALAVWQDVRDIAALVAETCRRDGKEDAQAMAESFSREAAERIDAMERFRREFLRLQSLTDEELEAERCAGLARMAAAPI